MTKINAKEYKCLKEIFSKGYRWFAKSKDFPGGSVYDNKPMKDAYRNEWVHFQDTRTKDLMDDTLFTFIHVDDEEPYNIAELIEEYEEDEFYNYIGWEFYESEETEVKKDIEWAKKEIKFDKDTSYPNYISKRRVYNILDQLDEPEVLTDKWIDDNSVYASSDGITEEYVHVDDLQNLLVPKQELPVVPTWFDEWWKDVAKGAGSLFHNIERFYEELFSSGTREMYNYISNPDNKKKLLNIIVNELEYEVGEEQKYFVEDGKHALLCKWESLDGWKVISTIESTEDDIPIEVLDYGLTEQEIKDYDERYWPFAVKVEELEE